MKVIEFSVIFVVSIALGSLGAYWVNSARFVAVLPEFSKSTEQPLIGRLENDQQNEPSATSSALLKGALREIAPLIKDLPPILLAQSSEDLAELLPLLMQRDGGPFLQSSIAFVVMKLVMCRDPELAFKHLLNLPSASSQERYFLALFEVWNDLDQEAALESVGGVLDTQTRSYLQFLMVSALREKDPQFTFNLIQRYGVANSEYTNLFKSWAISNVEEAYNHLKVAHSDPGFYYMLDGFCRGLAGVDSQKAFRIALELMNSNPMVPANVFEIYVRESFEEAMEAFNGITDEYLRRRLFLQAIGEIAKVDLQQAWEFAENFFSDSDFEIASSIIVAQDIYDTSASRIGDLIETIPIGRMRDDLVLSAAEKWGSVDPTAATEWLQRLDNLPPDAKSTLMRLEVQMEQRQSGFPIIDWSSFVEGKR